MYRIVIVLLLLLGSCARIKPPPGAPLDKIPPDISVIYPQPFETNVAPDVEFVILFSEYVERNATSKDIYLSPFHEGGFDTEWFGRRLKLRPKIPLETNRSWVLEIGTACRDLAGNRIADPVRISFSTGSSLDTLEISGRLANLQEKDFVQVWCWPAELFPRIEYHAAPWRTRPDSKGQFTFFGLPDGDFNLLAVADNNRNGRWDLLSEQAALADTILFAGDSYIPGLRLAEVFVDSLLLKKVQSIDSCHFVLNAVLNPASLLEIPEAERKDRIANRLRLQTLDLMCQDGRRIELDDIRQKGDNWLIVTPGLDSLAMWLVCQQNGDSLLLEPPNDLMLPAPFKNSPPATIKKNSLLPWSLEQGLKNRPGRLGMLVNSGDTLSIRPRFAGRFQLDWSHDSLSKGDELIVPAAMFLKMDNTVWPDSTLVVRIKENAVRSISTGSMEWSWDRIPANPMLKKRKDWRVVFFQNGKKLSEQRLRKTGKHADLPEGDLQLALYHDTNANETWDAGKIRPLSLAETWYDLPDTLEIISGWTQQNINLTLPAEIK
jgi:hypothetical protein